MSDIFRRPAEDSDDLYPGLYLHDQTVTGSIRCGGRLPLWAFASTAIHQDWTAVEEGWSPTEHYGYTSGDLATFLYDLLQMRGEFGRLLLVLANAERLSQDEEEFVAWWREPDLRGSVVEQLRRCLAALEPVDNPSP